MNTLSPHLRALALWPLLLCPAQAAFNPAVVSADARWVVFADVAALRESTLGREIIESVQRQVQPPPAYGIQFDLQKLFATIGNVTAYGTNFTADATLVDGALIIEGTGALRTIAEGWLAQATIASPKNTAEATDLPFPGYVLDRQLYIAFPPEPIIVIGKSQPQIVKARDVYRGQAPSLAQNPSSPLAHLLAKSGRAFGVAASVVPAGHAFAPNAPQARILELISSGLITLGEENLRTTLGARLVARSDATAEKLQKILQGMTAMMSLTEANDRQLAEFLQSATVERQGRTVDVQVGYSSERLTQMIRTVQQRAQSTAVQAREGAARSFGRKLVEWKLDKAPAGVPPGPDTIGEFSIENVRLTTGATITLSAQRPAPPRGAHALIDSVEILPLSGSSPGLRFEAENMRLRGYNTRNAPFASGGRLIGSLATFAHAQFEFPGVEGDYVIRVRYLEESAGTTTLAVHVRDPVAPQTQR